MPPTLTAIISHPCDESPELAEQTVEAIQKLPHADRIAVVTAYADDQRWLQAAPDTLPRLLETLGMLGESETTVTSGGMTHIVNIVTAHLAQERVNADLAEAVFNLMESRRG
jgi:hypothetical protein